MPIGTEHLLQACLLLAFVKETAMQKHALPLWHLISPKLGHKWYNVAGAEFRGDKGMGASPKFVVR